MENQTISKDVIFWEVDAQEDFMKPGGKLYVPGAEKLLLNLRRLTNAAREGRVFLVSHGCVHEANDPEFAQFPPHCIRGSAGAKLVPEAMADKFITIPNESGAKLPENLAKYQQIVLEKQTLDVFQSRHAESLLARLPREAEFIVFGVVTEYCVRFAAKGLLERGRRVSLVRDAIQTLNSEESKRTLEELAALGARFITTDDALRRVGAPSEPEDSRSNQAGT
ncbi:MAG: isochorismatase family cysteine hydrolase [Candidatus Acidiferrales bacterium]